MNTLYTLILALQMLGGLAIIAGMLYGAYLWTDKHANFPEGWEDELEKWEDEKDV